MAELTTKKRSSLRKQQFAMPGQRKYPVHDKSHAANAKARATQMYKKGKLSRSAMEKIHARANAVLKGK